MKPHEKNQEENIKLVRILAKDIPDNKKVLVGLTKIKGISWMMSNAICKKTKINKDKKIRELTPEEIKKIEEFVKILEIPEFLKNRRKDIETGEDKHNIGNNWDLQKEFDIKAMRKIKSYKGVRHSLGQPVRGQRTKSHFRKNKVNKRGIRKK
jgi:small subunit ribosomal protein S13